MLHVDLLGCIGLGHSTLVSAQLGICDCLSMLGCLLLGSGRICLCLPIHRLSVGYAWA